MKEKADQISERLLNYGVEIIKLTATLGTSVAGKHIANQLLRSATSAGANYEEACGAQSKPDFIHKLQIVLKEIRESFYWLKLIQRAEVSVVSNLNDMINETNQLSNIIAKSIITTRKNNLQFKT